VTGRRLRLGAILAAALAATPAAALAADDGDWREVSHTDTGNREAFGELTEMQSVVRLSNGTFVVVGTAEAGSAPLAWRSSDGSHWEAVAVPNPGLAGMRDVALGPDGRLVAVGYRGGSSAGDGSTQRAQVWTSADGGATWTDIPDQDGFAGASMAAVAVGPDGRWVAVGASATERRALAWTSPDGASWTRSPDLDLFVEAELLDVTAGSPGGPAFVAVGGAPVIQGAIWVSDDGVTWEVTAGAGADPAFNNSSIQAVTTGGVGYVAAGLTVEVASFDAAFWTSTDGRTWVPAADPEGADEQPIQDVAAAPDGSLVAVGFGLLMRGSLWTSDDGTAWREIAVPAAADLEGDEPRGVVAVARGEAVEWVAVGDRGTTEVGLLSASVWTTLDPVTSFVGSLPTPLEINLDPVVIASGAAAAAGVVLLVPFPGALFNSTWEANAEEIGRWGRGLRRRPGRIPPGGEGTSFWQRPIGIAAFFVLSAVIYSLLDPTFGPGDVGASGVTFIGMLGGLVAGTVLFALPTLAFHWSQTRELGRLRVLPGTIAVAAACVLVSRLIGFQPGYLYGLVIGFVFATELVAKAEGRGAFIAATWMLVVALVAWVALIPVSAAAANGSVGPTILQATLTTLVVGGLEGVAIGLLPMRFLPGEAILGWNRRAWAVLFGIGVFAFLHVLVHPSSGYLADTERAPLVTIVVLLVAFGAASIGLWAWFRFRRPPPTAPEPAEQVAST
jgi:photosystem II stability/assembly factor-like uncharacterized protein